MAVDLDNSDRRPLERCYLLLAQDGRHATLGRHTEPDEEMFNTAAEGLDRLRLEGWYVLPKGATTAPTRL